MAKHYDVVVLGGSLGALATAALLARRSWRVLVLGQGYRRSLYGFEGHTLARRLFTFVSYTSPVWSRVIIELAQSQAFRKRVMALDPMFQVLGKRLRLDVPPDAELFGTYVERVFPGSRRIVDELYMELARTNASADAAFERDAVWPPGTFWERRETERIAETLPHLDDGEVPSFLAQFPRDHGYRALVEVPAVFASHATNFPSFALARLHGAFTRGLVRLARGEDEVVDFLVDRIRAHGGQVELGEQAVRIAVKAGRVTGVLREGEARAVGANFLVSSLSTRGVVDLAPEFPLPRRVFAGLPELFAREFRFVLSAVVRDEGLAEPLGHEAFLLPDDARLPRVHLTRGTGSEPGTSLLVAEALFPDGTAVPVVRARQVVLDMVAGVLPYLEQHLVLVDSPHDGLPLWDYRTGRRLEVERALLRSGGASLEAEPMAARWLVEPFHFHGLGAEPLRTPLGGAFIVGPTVLPALGQEGELLAAWSVARLITRTDRAREKMRRELWSRVEIG